MEEYKIVWTTQTYKEINTAYCEVIKRKGSIDELARTLKPYEELSPLYVKFHYAKFYHSHRDYETASNVIQAVLSELETTRDYSIGFKPDLLQYIYQQAGESFCCNNQFDKARVAYQDYQLCLSRLKGLKDAHCFLSFRNYNEYSLSDLINNEITVCSPLEMNDPYDTLLFQWGEHQLKENNKPHTQLLYDSFMGYRIRSLTLPKNKAGEEMYRNTLMWAHYAGNHTGFCIRYHLSDKFIRVTENRRTVRLHKINYPKGKNPVNISADSINSKLAFCTKYKLWGYENEVRIIAYEPDIDGHFHSLNLDEDSYIENIYFGYRCPDQHIKTIKKILSGRQGIRFYKMGSNPENIYKLEPHEI